MNIKVPMLLVLTILAASRANAENAVATAALAAVERLGLLNGMALACDEKDAAARAKELMLERAPRTSQYGTVFQQGTQKGFMQQVQGKAACPTPGVFAGKIDALIKDLPEQPAAVE